MLIDISDEAGEDLTSAIAYLLRVNILAGEQLAADLEQAILNLAVFPDEVWLASSSAPGFAASLLAGIWCSIATMAIRSALSASSMAAWTSKPSSAVEPHPHPSHPHLL